MGHIPLHSGERTTTFYGHVDPPGTRPHERRCTVWSCFKFTHTCARAARVRVRAEDEEAFSFSAGQVRSGQVSQTSVESQRRLHRFRKAVCNDNDANAILFFAIAYQQVHSSKEEMTQERKPELLWAPKMWIVRSLTRQLPRRPEPRDVCMHKGE